TSISKKIIEDTGVILSHNTKECFSEVEFSCRQGIYTSRWEISVNRNGNLRDYEMRLFNNEGIVIEDKKGNVTESIEKLIGLNYEQFTRSIMLPQGDFALFLKSNKNERGKLLEKITGSSIYRELGQRAYLKSKEIDKELDFIKNRILALTAQKMEDEEYNEIKEKCQLIDQKQVELQNQISQTKQHIDIKKNIARLEKETQAAKNQLNAKTNDLDSFNKLNGERIKKHQQLIPFIDSVNEVLNVQRQIVSNQTKLKEVENQIEINIKKSLEVNSEIEELIKNSEKISDLPIENLNEFENRVKELDSNINLKETEYRAEFKTIKELSNDFGLNIQISETPQLIAEKISYKKKDTIAEINSLEQKYPKIHAESDVQNIENLNKLLEKVSKWEKDTITINLNQQSIEEAKKKLITVKNEIEAKQQLITDLNNQFEKVVLEHKNKESELKISQLEAKLENIRKQLQDGEPCPVCGSTEHPWADKSIAETSQLEKDVIELNNQKVKLKSQIDLEAGKLEQNKLSISELESKINSIQKIIEPLIEQANTIKAEQIAITKQDTPTDAISFIKTQIADIQKYRTLLSQLEKIEKTKTIISELLQIFVDAKELKQTKQKIYNGTDITKDCKLLRDRYSDTNNERVRLGKSQTELEKEITTNENQKKDKLDQLLPKLETVGYQSVNEAIKFIIPTEEYNNLNNKIQKLQQVLSTQKAVFETLDNHLQQAKKQDIKHSETELIEQLSKLNENYTSLMKNRDTFKEKLTTQNNIRKELLESEVKIAEINQKGEKWKILGTIIGCATGNVFNNIAQSITLKHLINKANRCIIDLNPRYRLAINDLSDDDALFVIDLDLGQQKRSTKTLSGGETFLVSLSLALGLADMASKETTVGSLFIDEGFGTLDPEMLDYALAMLESLQAKGNKSIGIISHVETLKERINVRIDLVPVAGQGYSKIVVTS
ncbi:MAG TPA: SbcC/MukB-like Walker B domain-containing protein, partial [Salinivirgaceae bacterium]|nr:SbcC/MukB-like Walker B domain-containing protein [Salinivirgaceae bacterium]